MNKWIELIIGLLLILIAIIISLITLGHPIADFGTAAWEFLKGGIIWLIGILGILFVLLGISDLKG